MIGQANLERGAEYPQGDGDQLVNNSTVTTSTPEQSLPLEISDSLEPNSRQSQISYLHSLNPDLYQTVENACPVTGIPFEVPGSRELLLNALQEHIRQGGLVLSLDIDLDNLKGLNDACETHEKANGGIVKAFYERLERLQALGLGKLFFYRKQAGGDEVKLLWLLPAQTDLTQLESKLQAALNTPTSYQFLDSENQVKEFIITSTTGHAVTSFTGTEEAATVLSQLEDVAEHEQTKKKIEKILIRLKAAIEQQRHVNNQEWSRDRVIDFFASQWGTARMTEQAMSVLLRHFVNDVLFQTLGATPPVHFYKTPQEKLKNTSINDSNQEFEQFQVEYAQSQAPQIYREETQQREAMRVMCNKLQVATENSCRVTGLPFETNELRHRIISQVETCWAAGGTALSVSLDIDDLKGLNDDCESHEVANGGIVQTFYEKLKALTDLGIGKVIVYRQQAGGDEVKIVMLLSPLVQPEQAQQQIAEVLQQETMFLFTKPSGEMVSRKITCSSGITTIKPEAGDSATAFSAALAHAEIAEAKMKITKINRRINDTIEKIRSKQLNYDELVELYARDWGRVRTTVPILRLILYHLSSKVMLQCIRNQPLSRLS